MSKKTLKEAGSEDKMTGAESAVKADATVAAKQQQEKMAGKNEKGFFAMSDKDKLQKIMDFGQERLNLLINDHADDFYNVQSSMVMEADLSGRRTSCIAEAIKAQTDHLLGFLMPGQVLMLLREDKLESDLASMKADLANILGQLSYYKQENKQIKAVVETSNNLVRTMTEKNQEQINVINQMQTAAEENKAQIVDLRREIHLLRETDRGQRPAKPSQDQSDQANRGRSNSRGRGGGSNRGGRGTPAYGGPCGSQGRPDPWNTPHVTGTNAPFNSDCSSNKFHMDSQGKTASQKREEARYKNIYGNGNGSENDTGMDSMPEPNTDQGFQDPKRSRNKNKNKQPETANMTKKQIRHAKEVIIHKVPSQKKEEYKDENEYKENEANILYELLEELTPKYLHDHGVVVNIKKDIDYMDRFDKHYDEENYGMAPIRLRFKTVKMANKVLKAAKRGGCLKGRRPSDFGRYAVPKKYNNAGILNDKADEEANKLAELRPKFYFRPSLPREERQEKEKEKEEREKKKNDPETIAFRDRKKEVLDKRVRFGNLRNFGQGEADKISEKSIKEREDHWKEIREKRAAKEKERKEREEEKERERLEGLKVNKVNFPHTLQSGSGSGGTKSDNQDTTFHSASSSPSKEQSIKSP